MMKLYHTPGTSAFRCRWMLEELGVPFELLDVNLGRGDHKQPEYLKIHPLGSVPALVDGAHTYIESAAIVMHLADRDAGHRFAPPAGSAARGHYYQWIMFAMTNLDHVIHAPYLRYFFHQETATHEQRDALAHHLAVSDDLLRAYPYLLGDFSAADIIFGGLLLWAEASGQLLGREPQTDYLARLKVRPAFQRAIAE